jgi:23S rRNA (cytosine1962-C5)-methyltransferase
MQSHLTNETDNSRSSPQAYELIDFGHGRKLESFGGVIVSRPCPAAHGKVSLPSAWESATLIYDSSQDHRLGRWLRPMGEQHPAELWTVEWNDSSSLPSLNATTTARSQRCFKLGDRPLRFIVRPQTSGQLGLFPEHWLQWPWYDMQMERWRNWHTATAKDAHSAPKQQIFSHQVSQLQTPPKSTPRVLHLFAYTGATTLALAAMGAEVTHIDAMRSAVEWARDNCRESDRESLPIRWIVDDARKYVERERKRGKKYDLVILDPPSYGHGAAGEAWSIQRDLEPLLCSCAELIANQGIGIVLTGHSLDIELQEVHRAVRRGSKKLEYAELEVARSILTDRSGRPLDCGYVARFLTDCDSRACSER